MPQKTPDENAKLTLDEGAFQRLLSAAFVIQEHNDSLRSQTPDPVEFKASDLSEIADTQNLIRGKRLDLLTAAAVIVARSQKIAHAAAGAIALISKRELSYISSSGVAAPPVGTTVTLDESLSVECVRTGQFLVLPNLKTMARSQAELFLSREMQCFASVPIFQDQQVAGVMELYFNRPNAIDGTTLRTCQLLAGLLTGTIASHPGPPPNPVQSNPLEQLRPQLDRMLETEDPEALPRLLRDIVQGPPVGPPAASASLGGRSVSTAPAGVDTAGTTIHQNQPPVARCRKCGCPLEGDESFCGLCGTARATASEAAMTRPDVIKTTAGTDRLPALSNPSAPLEPATPSPAPAEKPSSALPPPQLPESFSGPLAGPPDIPEKSDALPPELQEILARFPEDPEIISPPPSSYTSASAKIFDPGPIRPAKPATPPNGDAQGQVAAPEPSPLETKTTEATLPELKAVEQKSAETNLTAPNPPMNPAPTGTANPIPTSATPANPQWKSASETRAWLESVKVSPQRKHWMAEHRANLYLGAAAILLVLVLFGVGMPADLQPGKPQLNWFDSMLVNLGIAEAPSIPVYLGNPTTKVWVDLHTALYYCPIDELYGKTHDGKFETQREAQQDQFEPASRHACP